MSVEALRLERTDWHPLREAVRAGWVLGLRELRTSIRTPAYLVPSIVGSC